MKVYLTPNHEIEVNILSTQVKGGWWSKFKFQRDDPPLTPNGQEDLMYIHTLLKDITNPILFDVGANVGMFSLLTTLHDTLVVHAFEPSPYIMPAFRENCGLNQVLDRVLINEVALHNEDATVTLKVPMVPTLAGLATMGEPHRYAHWINTPVSALRLDTYVESKDIKQIDVIKIDTEGAELNILQGGENTIKRLRPDIFCECYSKNTHQFGYEPQTIIDLLVSWGYSYQWTSRENVHFYM